MSASWPIHAFPGLSCSIVPNDEFHDEWWFMQHTVVVPCVSVAGSGTEEATAFMFKMMANKYTIAWNVEKETSMEAVVPGHTRLAHEYLAALPVMKRGVYTRWVWRVVARNRRWGVLYPFADMALPDGVPRQAAEDGAVTRC